MSNRSRLRVAAVGLLSTALMSIGPALAWADDGSIIIDFVRHAESIDNKAGIIDTTPPGTGLDTTGDAQASAIATTIQNEFGTKFGGLFDSQELRTAETAAPLAARVGG